MDYLEIMEVYKTVLEEINLISDNNLKNQLINNLEDVHSECIYLHDEIKEIKDLIEDSNDNYYNYMELDTKKEELNKLICKMEYITDFELLELDFAI